MITTTTKKRNNSTLAPIARHRAHTLPSVLRIAAATVTILLSFATQRIHPFVIPKMNTNNDKWTGRAEPSTENSISSKLPFSMPRTVGRYGTANAIDNKNRRRRASVRLWSGGLPVDDVDATKTPGSSISTEREETEEEAGSAAVPAATENDEESLSSPLDKLNKFLDTPILDANNRQDQGFVAETLKEFVRNEPELAQVSFSIAVVAIMVLLLKLYQSVF